MRTLALTFLLLPLFTGCSESKPDPRDHPNFVDTTDPNNLRMPGSTPPAKTSEGVKVEE